jgi:unsaturated rhamnogalacturonyl hydrolase
LLANVSKTKVLSLAALRERFGPAMRKFAISLAALGLLSGCTTTETAAVNVQAAAVDSLQPAVIRQTADRAANWQLANMTNYPDFIRNISPQTDKRRGWVQGTFFLGLADYAERTGQPRYQDALIKIAQEEGWRLGDRLYHADDHLVGLVYSHIGKPAGKKDALGETQKSFDQILAKQPDNAMMHPDKAGDPECSDRWCWADALFMAPATWWELSRKTGDPRYAAYGDKEFWVTHELLYDKEAHLFFRDSRFFARRGDDGEKLFWSRGNGWVYGGLVNVLRAMPKDDPRRAKYLALFRQMSDKLVSIQTPEGLWRASLLATSKTPPETSGTGFFVYGLAWGVNEGLLTGDQYRAAAQRGWRGLAANVDGDGKLGYVQQIGDRPTDVRPDDHQFYGVGALLLAAGQMLKLK